MFLLGRSVAYSPKDEGPPKNSGWAKDIWLGPNLGGDFSHQQRSTKYVALPISWNFTSTIGRSYEPWRFCLVFGWVLDGFSEMTGMAISGSLWKMLILNNETNVLEIFSVNTVAKRHILYPSFEYHWAPFFRHTKTLHKKASPFDTGSPKKRGWNHIAKPLNHLYLQPSGKISGAYPSSTPHISWLGQGFRRPWDMCSQEWRSSAWAAFNAGWWNGELTQSDSKKTDRKLMGKLMSSVANFHVLRVHLCCVVRCFSLGMGRGFLVDSGGVVRVVKEPLFQKTQWGQILCCLVLGNCVEM